VIVVSNSSPLIALARIGRLNLLASLYECILVPAEVHHEVTVAGKGLPGAEEVCKVGCIEVVSRESPVDASLEHACQSLGAGERGAILLAKSLPADLLLLDEWKACRIAREAGLTITGCRGFLRPVLGRALCRISIKLTSICCGKGSDSTLDFFRTVWRGLDYRSFNLL
jgi:predicted nucleic acid-binding protein